MLFMVLGCALVLVRKSLGGTTEFMSINWMSDVGVMCSSAPDDDAGNDVQHL